MVVVTPLQHHISLMHGWVPFTVQALTVAVLLAAIGWRSRRWRVLCVPAAALAGVGAAVWSHWRIASDGLASDPAPHRLWVWIAVSAAAVVLLVLGWHRAPWWRRGAALLSVPLCLLSTALALNFWVGYFPTVQNAWNQLTAGPLPDQTDQAAIAATAEQSQQRHTLPARGSVVPVSIPSTASGFKHRGELVYLPPAWFASTPPPKLPTVMMIGGEFNTPADWLRAGGAISTIDSFAAAHGGNAPVFVFVDSGGAFNNDTECVNGPRGNAADHLTKDVAPFVESRFGVSADRANWGVVGWSMGGTCAVDLATMHPDMFSSFVDIAGDLAPNSGTKAQTIQRLFGGDAAAWTTYDPTSVITRHGRYQAVSGWFAISGNPQPPRSGAGAPVAEDAVGLGGRDATGNPGDQTTAAQSLCALGSANGITCAVVAQPGKHDWPFASRVFTAALPWLASAIDTPGVPAVALPGHTATSAPPATETVADQQPLAAGGR
ncbi:alpha/beta hydrolase-fold protein [Mycobacterium sp. ACS4331]|uniref:alpha/beta hydrolase n=1 Tax=Mycobacterium sp. ACS4331 TaxID=1834121 RepID=UPI000AAF9062|nr:alpha/beta hydrolase-fold protein [Mycobacterium sp. ACS4331]